MCVCKTVRCNSQPEEVHSILSCHAHYSGAAPYSGISSQCHVMELLRDYTDFHLSMECIILANRIMI